MKSQAVVKRMNVQWQTITIFRKWKQRRVKVTFCSLRLQVLCEVETSVETLGLRVAGSLNQSILTEHYQNKADLTQMLIQDWGIFTFYESFLKEWLKAFNDATAKGPSRYCTPERKIRDKPEEGMMERLCARKKTKKKYMFATIHNQNTSEGRQKEFFKKRILTKRPMGKNIPKKRLPKNTLMRNKRKKLQKHIYQ